MTPPAQASSAFAHVGPNWFASVMGTGIVANAAVLLPPQVPGQRAFALGVWIVAVVLLGLLVAATAMHWAPHREAARGHALNASMAPFYGAPPMAFLTVGAGALLVGRDVIGMHPAVIVDSALWIAGTAGGLLAALIVPYLMFTRHDLKLESTSATWLMPIVPPMVSAATGAALIAHLPAGQARLTLLVACYAMFGLSLLASLVTITLVWARLAYHREGPARMVPTLWIVLGPLGQSISAACLLGAAAPGVIQAPYASAMSAMGVLYGAPVFGFAMLWLGLAAAITIRTARRHLPFSLTWWSFTFPVGTVVTGVSELALRTRAGLLAWVAVALYALLVGAWLTAAYHTVRGTLSGSLLQPPEKPAAASAQHVSPPSVRNPLEPAHAR